MMLSTIRLIILETENLAILLKLVLRDYFVTFLVDKARHVRTRK